jgi:hypothetical protein
MTVRSPPLGAVADLVSVQQRGWEHRAIGDPAGRIRPVLAEQRRSDERVHAVRSNHRISLRDASVGEVKYHTAVCTLFESRELMVET